MNSRMDEFRAFVGRHPRLRDEVKAGRRTWQNIYEEWAIYGEQDTEWSQYQTENTNAGNQQQATQNNANGQNQNGSPSLMESVRNIVGYIQRINPDSLNNTLNTVQKAIQIFQTFGSKGSKGTSYLNSPYDEWWD